MKMGKHHKRVHEAFTDLKKPFDAVKVYEAMCKLVKLGEDAIERGIGKLYKDGHLTPKEGDGKRRKLGKAGKRGPAGAIDEDDFS